jgi:hypothetical protein
MNIQQLTKTIKESKLGTDQLLDAVEEWMDEGFDLDLLDALLFDKNINPVYPEILDSHLHFRRWKQLAGTPNPNIAHFFEVQEADKIRYPQRTMYVAPPSVTSDRHRNGENFNAVVSAKII